MPRAKWGTEEESRGVSGGQLQQTLTAAHPCKAARSSMPPKGLSTFIPVTNSVVCLTSQEVLLFTPKAEKKQNQQSEEKIPSIRSMRYETGIGVSREF